jgi:hypothetical protein
MLSLILRVFALVLFLIAAFVNPVDPWRGRLMCVGLACWVGADILVGVAGAPLLR